MDRKLLIVSGNLSYVNRWSHLAREVKEDLDIYAADCVNRAYEFLMDFTVDVFLLDVAIADTVNGDTSGLWLAQRIRQIPKYMLTPIIFIAPVDDPELYAYKELNCLGYFKRPFEKEELQCALARALHYRTPREADKWAVFRAHGQLFPVRVSELVYIVNEEHILNLHLCNGEVRRMAYKSLALLLAEADVECLFQCSRSAIVNKNYIASIDVAKHCITLTGGRGNVEIGYTYRKKIMEEFFFSGSCV